MVNVDELNENIDKFGAVVGKMNQLPHIYGKISECAEAETKILEENKNISYVADSLNVQMANVQSAVSENSEKVDEYASKIEGLDKRLAKQNELILEDGKLIQILNADTEKLKNNIDKTNLKLDKLKDLTEKNNKQLEEIIKQVKDTSEQVDAIKNVCDETVQQINSIKKISIVSLIGVFASVAMLVTMMLASVN